MKGNTQMNKKFLVILIIPVLLGCNYLFPQKASSTESESFSSDGLTIVRLQPGDGNLQTMLANEAQKAEKLGQIPVVEFDATWCPPCQAIDKAIKAKNKLMLDAYAGTYIIKLDVD